VRKGVIGKAPRQRCGETGCGHHRRLLGLWILLTVELLEITRGEELVEKPGVKVCRMECLHSDQRPEQALPKPASNSTGASASQELSQGKAKSSEGMIPAEIWDEILGLAQGRPPRAEPDPGPPAEEIPISVPREEGPRETSPATVVARRESRPPPEERAFPSSHGAEAALHKTDPSDVESRLAVSTPPLPAAGRGGSRRVKAELFGDGSPEDLRKAIILQEVLGEPLAFRKD